MSGNEGAPKTYRHLLAAIALPVASLLTLFALAFTAERMARPAEGVAIDQMVEVAPNSGNTLMRRGATYRGQERMSQRVTLEFAAPQSETGDKAVLVTAAQRDVTIRYCGEPMPGGPGAWRAERFKYFAPHFFSLAESECTDDRITLDLYGGEVGRSWLRTVFVGPEEEVQAAYRMRRFLAIDLAMVATGVAATASILALAASVLAQNRVLFVTFATMMAAWAMRNLYYVGPLSEWSLEAIEVWYFVTTYGLLVASAVFVNQWTIKSRFVTRWLITPIALLFAASVAVQAFQGFPASSFAQDAGWIIGFVAIVLMFALSAIGVYRRVGVPWFESFMFLTAGAGAVLDLVGTTMPGVSGAIIGNEGLTIPYAPIMALFATWAIVIFLGRQNRSVREQLEGANVTLSEKLAEREAELNAVYEEREREAKEATLLRERQRIMQDIHDGFGGRLLALLLQAEDRTLDRTTLRDKLRDGLQDLRLIVDSMDTADGDMGLAFGALRGRLEPDLSAAGIELEWDIDIEETDAVLGSRETLSTYRIIQEAVANTIRHSGGTRMRIAIALVRDERLTISLSDNGSGLQQPRGDAAGQGLRNIQNRVHDLGGKVTMGNRDPGFGMEIEIPVRAGMPSEIQELQ